MEIGKEITYQSWNMSHIIYYHEYSGWGPAPAHLREQELTELSLSPETLTNVKTLLSLGHVLRHGRNHREGEGHLRAGLLQIKPGCGETMQEEEGEE